MHRMAGDLDLEPHDADLRHGEHARRRLGNERGIGAIAALQAGQRAVAGAFLLDDRLLVDVGRRLVAQRAERAQRKDVEDEAGLHVARAAAIHPAVLDRGLERIARPHLVRPFGHDVDMAVQDQRRPFRAGRPPGADHVPGVVVILGMRRVARQVLQVVDLDLPAIDAQPVLLEQAGHHVLRRRLVEARRGDLHQIGQHLGLVVEPAIDRVHDLGLERCFEHARTLAQACCGVHSRRGSPYSDCALIRSHVSSRVTFTPFTSAGGGVRIMRSPSKRTLRTCGAVKRTGSQLASTMVVSVLPSNV